MMQVQQHSTSQYSISYTRPQHIFSNSIFSWHPAGFFRTSLLFFHYRFLQLQNPNYHIFCFEVRFLPLIFRKKFSLNFSLLNSFCRADRYSRKTFIDKTQFVERRSCHDRQQMKKNSLLFSWKPHNWYSSYLMHSGIIN